jgi:hypothetical protein
VCIDDAGRDDGTLALELNAYRSTDVDFFAIFFDCLNAKVASTFGLPVSAHIGVLVSPPEKLLKRLPEHTPEELREQIRQAAHAGRPFGITLGCVISKARIKRVLDLRRREAQSWFFHRYIPEGPIPTPAREFTDILPELLQPQLGGSTGSNMRLQAVGADLRAAGVNALIYPSARNDVEVSYRHNVLTHWRGWNLVLYPGNMPREGVHDDLGGWETEF